jgi:hypothetical protein
MNQEPEQIGELVYQPHPDYPYPFPVDKPPHFWMTEQTGKLAEAMEPYFNGEALKPEQLTLIKAYLQQYVERAVIAAATQRELFVRKIAKLRTTRQIELFAEELAEVGIEPF